MTNKQEGNKNTITSKLYETDKPAKTEYIRTTRTITTENKGIKNINTYQPKNKTMIQTQITKTKTEMSKYRDRKGDNNALVQKAQRVKAVPYLASILLTTGLLGWGIPAFNIMLTRKKVKGEQGDTFKGNKTSAQLPANILESKLSPAQKTIINNFLKRPVK